MIDLTAFRHALHRAPELSGAEAATARTIRAALEATAPDMLLEGLGGHGVAACYDGTGPGPTIVLRCELDALPIPEQPGRAHGSTIQGHAHLCGHDGHMTILVGVAQHLGAVRPARGRVVLLFQPAEETGAGGPAIAADPRFAALRPDMAFAMHNMPGLPLGSIAVAPGPAACASVGLEVTIHGRTAHAAQPETALSPAPVISALLDWVTGFPAAPQIGPDFRLATLCHASIGAPAFGIAPGDGRALVALRTARDNTMAALETECRAVVDHAAASAGVTIRYARHEAFPATINAPDIAAIVARAAKGLGLPHAPFALPMRPSEDFGALSSLCPIALFFLGAGEETAPLHDPRYDFPDDLSATAIALWMAIIAQVQAQA
jgi:amidohydrolase